MATFALQVLTPEGVFFSGEVDMVILPAEDGELGILANCQPMVVALNDGVLRIKQGEEYLMAVVSDGYSLVEKGGTTVLAQAVEWPEQIDVSRAQAALDRAQRRISNQEVDERTYNLNTSAVQRAKARLRIARNKGDKDPR